MLVDKTPSY